MAILHSDRQSVNAPEIILANLQRLRRPGQVTELRALHVSTPSYRRHHTVSGYFDYEHLEEMSKEAARLSPQSKGVYFALNPINPDLLSRRCNRVDIAESGDLTGDQHIIRRHWMLVDCDPVRPSGISSTEEEKVASLDTMNNVCYFLKEEFSWPDPLAADSGNGYHLLYQIDLPADDGGIVQRCLQALAKRYDSDKVKIDQTVYNASRICKLYGTLTRKGDSTAERPHRLSTLLEPIPSSLVIVTREQLDELAGPPATTPPPNHHRGNGRSFDIRQWLRDHGISYQEQEKKGNRGQTVFRMDCVFNAEHKSPDACVMQDVDGTLSYKCFHNSCHGNGWPQFKQAVAGNNRQPHRDSAPPPQDDGEYIPDDPPPASDLPPAGYNPRLYTSAEFFAMDFRQEFLVRGVLVKNQLGVFGGGKKQLKSSQGIDLAVSLDTATPFLGYEKFTVPHRKNVLLLNGESGDATIQESARRIARARGINPNSLNIVWGSQLPQLTNALHLRDLATILRVRSIDVLMVDPSYLCLLAGAGPDGPQPSNLFAMGMVYSEFAKCCLAVGTTPLLFTHTKKDRTKEPPDLDDLAFAGIAEVVRQWVLVSRREAYEGDGIHKLWLSIGGSAGHSTLAHLDVDEGVLDEDFQGRKWETTLTPYHEAKRELKAGKEQQRAAQNDRDEIEVAAVIDKLSKAGDVATVTRIRNGSPISRARTDGAIERLRLAKLFEQFSTTKGIGNTAERPVVAFRRKEEL